MRSFASFAQVVPSRELFKFPTNTGDLQTLAHNEWTLCLWGVYEAERISTKTGQPLKASTIEQRITLLKGLLSHRYGFQLAGDAPRLKALVRCMKGNDPTAGQRRKRRGLRNRHLRKAWKKHPWVRRQSFLQLNKWAALTVARHTLARGGELAHVTRGDVTFHRAASGARYAILMLRPLKKKGGASQAKVPQIIGECTKAEGACAYAALRRLCEADIWNAQATTQPLFRTKRGKAMSTDGYRAIVRELAKALGMNPKEFGAHSTRIGGATDLSGTGRTSQLLLQAKGRWASDIGAIYARMTRRAQLAVSDLMYECRSKDLEEIMPDFVQPA